MDMLLTKSIGISQVVLYMYVDSYKMSENNRNHVCAWHMCTCLIKFSTLLYMCMFFTGHKGVKTIMVM